MKLFDRQPSFIRHTVLCATFFCIAPSASHAVPAVDKDLAECRRLLINTEQGKAAQLASKKIAAGKNLAQWYELRALALNVEKERSGDPREAEKDIRKALELAPNDEHIVATAAFIFAPRGSGAVYIFPKVRESVKLHPQNGRCHAALAACLQATHDPLAGEEIATAIKLDPGDYDVNTQAAAYFLKQANMPETKQAYERMVKFNPKSANAFLQKALYERGIFELKAAARDFQKATELNPKNNYAYNVWAKVLKKDKQYSEAIKVFTAMYNNGDQSSATLGRRADCYAHLHQNEKAITDYSEAIKKFGLKGGESSYDGKGALLLGRDQRVDYRKYWLSRIQCREQIGRTDQALKELNMFIDGDTNNDSAIDIRQVLLRKKGEYAKALVDLDRLIAKDPYVAERYQARAQVFKKLGRVKEAQKDLIHADNVDKTGSP